MYSCFRLVVFRCLSSEQQGRSALSTIVMIVCLFVMATCLILFTVSHLARSGWSRNGEEKGMGRRKEWGGEGNGERREWGEKGMGRRREWGGEGNGKEKGMRRKRKWEGEGNGEEKGMGRRREWGGEGNGEEKGMGRRREWEGKRNGEEGKSEVNWGR